MISTLIRRLRTPPVPGILAGVAAVPVVVAATMVIGYVLEYLPLESEECGCEPTTSQYDANPASP
jgi:hypothetical protein